MACVVFFYVARRVSGRPVAYLATALLAVSPWMIHISRYGVPTSEFLLYTLLGLYFILPESKVLDNRKLSLCLAMASFGIAVNIHAIGVYTIPLFFLAILLSFREVRDEFLEDSLIYLPILLLFTLPSLTQIFTPQINSATNARYSGRAYTIVGSSSGLTDFLVNVFERMYQHLSLDFLVLTGGKKFVENILFTEGISSSSFYRVSPGWGLLNWSGLLLYPSVAYILFELKGLASFRHRETEQETESTFSFPLRSQYSERKQQFQFLLLWLSVYLVASTVPFYQNPNPLRNIIGLPVMILIISIFCIDSYHVLKERDLALDYVWPLLIVVVVLLPAMAFTGYYHSGYQTNSAPSHDYGYDTLAAKLVNADTEDRLVLVFDQPYTGDSISYYSGGDINPQSENIVFDNNNTLNLRWYKNTYQERFSEALIVTPDPEFSSELENLGFSAERGIISRNPDGTPALYSYQVEQDLTVSPVVSSQSGANSTIRLTTSKTENIIPIRNAQSGVFGSKIRSSDGRYGAYLGTASCELNASINTAISPEDLRANTGYILGISAAEHPLDNSTTANPENSVFLKLEERNGKRYMKIVRVGMYPEDQVWTLLETEEFEPSMVNISINYNYYANSVEFSVQTDNYRFTKNVEVGGYSNHTIFIGGLVANQEPFDLTYQNTSIQNCQ
jgi:hypothetical protein